ncbi:hypothetical protein FRC11_004656 [Ceratobasidium sp. 423]|nr:hypothetical protein FRC11_004656 [Ceratobasidium sp. 423]
MKISGALVAGGLFQVAAAATGPNWPGFKGLRYFFAFGDSYTTVGFNSWASVPSDTNPLGVGYPGSTTAGGANWVGYLTVQYNQSKFWSFDYAVSGNEVSGVSNQVNQDFLSSQGAGNKPSRGAPIAATISTLFNLQETLYNTGARNFLFVNVPPTNRCPFSNNNATLASLVNSWNTQLKASGEAFQAKHSDVHQYMAEDLANFLASQTGSATNPATTTTVTRTTTTATSQVSTTTTTSAPASTATGTVPKWGQCGGTGYTGPTTCVGGTTCTYSNPYYSQCL